MNTETVTELYDQQRAALQEEQRAEIEDRKRRKIEALIQRSGIPKRHANSRIDNFEARTPQHKGALTTAKDCIDNFQDYLDAGRCILLVGEPGTGKTHLACAIVRAICEQGRKAEYHRVPDVIRMIRECWRKDSDVTELQMLGSFRSADLFVLDEVGVQFGTDAERFHLFDIIDGRYMDMKPTIVVSNCTTASELRDYLGERSIDRLREGGGTLYELGGKSKRGEK